MAINDIKIKSHDIYLERNSDKGGNLTIGTASSANSNLIVHGNITGDSVNVGSGGLSVGGSITTESLIVNGNITGNIAGNASTADRINTTKSIGSYYNPVNNYYYFLYFITKLLQECNKIDK